MNIFERVAEIQKEDKIFALATLVYTSSGTPRKIGARMIVYEDGSIEGSVGGGALEKQVIQDALKLMREGKSERFVYDLTEQNKETSLGMACGGSTEVLIESFGKKEKLFVFGAGHIGRKLAGLCEIIEMPCWVVDNREDFAKEDFFPDSTHVVFSDFEESFSRLPIDEESFVVIVTYGHNYDGICLKKALDTKARYIGVIGSKSKVRAIKKKLSSEGIDVTDERIFSPIGLHIGNHTPGEIAVSIIAEILKIKSGGSGKHFRELVNV